MDVHDALEEALENALAHANYYGRRGILVVKKGKELSISNPGTIRVTKEDKILEYIRQNGSISSRKAADIGGYKSKTGARKLLDKMIEKGLITKIGNGPATKYVI